MGRRNAAVIVGLFNEENYQDEGQGSLDGVDDERPVPGFFGNDEGGEKGAEEGGDYHCGLPKIDLSGVFVEEKHVLEEHQTALNEKSQNLRVDIWQQ